MESFEKSGYKTLEEWVLEAREEALNRGIEANTIIINKNFAFVKEFSFKDPYFGYAYTIPPMILGMEIFVKDMPDKQSFLMYKAAKTERDKAIEQIQQETAKAIVEDFESHYPLLTRFDNSHWINRIKEKYGLDMEKENDR